MNSLSNIHLSKRELVILNATLELVAAEGLLKTSISKISKRAKSSPGIVYHYFASKDEIMDTLFISIVTEMMAFILNNVNADGDGLVLDRYKKLWMRKYQYHLENPEKTVFIEQFKNSSYYTAERELENQQLMGGLLLIGNADIEKGLLVNLPLDII
ncbi:MAG: TetR/AcrR family transcriptional regulator [Chloroflexota bacterium]